MRRAQSAMVYKQQQQRPLETGRLTPAMSDTPAIPSLPPLRLPSREVLMEPSTSSSLSGGSSQRSDVSSHSRTLSPDASTPTEQVHCDEADGLLSRQAESL
jgi:hypothetical protein